MTRKDYVAIAKAINRAYKEINEQARKTGKEDRDGASSVLTKLILMKRLEEIFEEDNPNFDVSRFRKAVEQE